MVPSKTDPISAELGRHAAVSGPNVSRSMRVGAKSGPKRKAGERFPGGKLKPTDRDSSGPPGALVRRLFDLAKADAADPRLATAIGWLRLHDILSDRQFAAAEAYARLRGQYEAIMQVPRRTAASPSYGDGVRRGSKFLSERQVRRIRENHDAMLASLEDWWPEGTIVDGKMPRQAAVQSQALLDRVCIDDQHPMATELKAFCRALDRLVKHFRITN